MLQLPGLLITDDLQLRIGGAAVRLTATDGFALAETLLRGSTRLAIEEEAAATLRTPLPPRSRRTRRLAA